MSLSEEGTSKNQIAKKTTLLPNIIENLNEEKESILSEVLRCYVCLELPLRKQVRICEAGHHFCLSCHSKMEVCGICRGKLLGTRNFVVEQLLTKLANIFDISGDKLSPAEPPVNLSKGSYRCLHLCSCKMPSYRMLSHLRDKHSDNLIENIRSNPYSGRFSFTFKLHFKQDAKYVWSAYVADMGLFTVESTFSDSDYFGCIRGLGDSSFSSLFKCQLVIRIPNKQSQSSVEFGITNSPVSSYLDDKKSIVGNGLKVKGSNLLEHINLNDVITIFFSIWKKSDKLENKENPLPSVFCLPERQLFFQNARKVQRNRNRNMRRKRLKEEQKDVYSQFEKLLEDIRAYAL